MILTIESVLSNTQIVSPTSLHWDEERQVLHWIDIVGNTLKKFDPATITIVSADLGGREDARFVIPVKDKKNFFIIGRKTTIMMMFWNEDTNRMENIQLLFRIAPMRTFWGEARCDLQGRLYAGDRMTTNSETGYVYAIEDAQPPTIAITDSRNLGCLGWNFKENKMFFVATNDHLIFRYDYYPSTGVLNPGYRIWFSLEDHHLEGRPCSLQMDIANNLWVALFTTGQIIKIDGKEPEILLNKFELHESKYIKSIAWGGTNLDELYVVVERIPITSVDCLINNCSRPSCGCSKNTGLYKITGTGSRGYPANKYGTPDN